MEQLGGRALRALVADPATVRLIGDFDFGDLPTFEAAVGEAAPAPSPLTIDVAEMSFLGSTGVRAFLEVRRQRRDLLLRGASAQVRKVLDIAGADRLFTLV